jgi:hypothetical protein
MKTPERREILRLLGPLSDLAEDMRFGQLVANLVTLTGGTDAGSIWDMEDEQLIPAIRKLTDDLTSLRAARSAPAGATPA